MIFKNEEMEEKTREEMIEIEEMEEMVVEAEKVEEMNLGYQKIKMLQKISSINSSCSFK